MTALRGGRGLVVLAALAMTWCLTRVPVRWEWDTTYLYYGLQGLVTWARSGFEGRPDSPAPFPPFQYVTGLPAVLLSMAGMPLNVYAWWGFLNLIGLAGTVAALWHVGRRHASPRVGWMLVAVMLSGPLVAYAPSTFNELAATAVTACFAAAVVGRGGAVLSALLFLAAAMTKELAAPLLVPLWLAGLWMRREELGRAGLSRHVAAMSVAFVAAVGIHAGFNWIRYGTVLNTEYLAEELLVRRWDRRAQNAAAIWLGPNGGVVPFWPTLVAAVVGACVTAFRGRNRTTSIREKLERLIPAAAVSAMLGALTLALSGWHQPFGWWCWGPRLILPWLPAALIALVAGYPGAFKRLAQCLSGRALIATAVVTCVPALPHLMMVANPARMSAFFMPDERFPQGAARNAPEPHYARNVYLAWQKWPPLLAWPFTPVPEPAQILATLGYLGALVVLLSRAGRKEEPYASVADHEAAGGATVVAAGAK